MSTIMMGRDTATGAAVEIPITNGAVDVNATVEAPVGGATSAKQDEQTVYLDAIEGKLPTLGQALAAACVPVVLPAAQITSLQAPTVAQGTAAAASAPWPVQVVQGGAALFPAAALATGTLVTPTTTQVIALKAGYNSGLGRPLLEPVNSTGVASAFAVPIAPASTSRSTSLQVQRTIAGFSCTPRVVRAWSSLAGYVCLANASSAVADGFTPYGGHIKAIAAGGSVDLELDFAETFTAGLVVVFCTQIHSGASLATVIGTTNCCMFTGQYD